MGAGASAFEPLQTPRFAALCSEQFQTGFHISDVNERHNHDGHADTKDQLLIPAPSLAVWLTNRCNQTVTGNQLLVSG